MAKTIWKYEIPFSDTFTLDMPRGAKPASVAMQDDQPCLWAVVDPTLSPVSYKFAVVGTGHPAPDDAQYLGQFQLHNGILVFHVFALT